jgi:cobalt-zinc-cadmium efflux system protein
LGHSHSHHTTATGWVLKVSIIATFAFTAFEVFAGLRSNSLSLLSDAGHNFTDALALLLAAIGFYVQAKPADEYKTFGYHRAGVVTAFLNAATLVLISLVIFYEAIIRILHPEPVDDRMMFWVALAALVLNGGIMLMLAKAGQSNDINLRAAFIHMLGDALGAAAIIIGAVVIRYTHWTYIDPILSLALGGLILYSAWDIIHESLNILLEGLPRGLELPAVTEAMNGIEGVLDVHDLHVWSIGSNTHALCSHVLIDDMPASASGAILKRINSKLCSIGIHHTTIQFEHVPCVLTENPCRMGTDHVHEHDHSHGHHH